MEGKMFSRSDIPGISESRERKSDIPEEVKQELLRTMEIIRIGMGRDRADGKRIKDSDGREITDEDAEIEQRMKNIYGSRNGFETVSLVQYSKDEMLGFFRAMRAHGDLDGKKMQ